MQQAFYLTLEHGRLVQGAGVGQGREFRIGHRGPEQIREPRGELMIVEPYDLPSRLGLPGGRDKKKLRRNQNRLQHQPERRGVGEVVATPQIENAHQHVQFRCRWRTAIGAAGERAGHVAGGRAGVGAGGGRCAEETLLDGGRRRAIGREEAIQHGVGDPEILFRLERRECIQVSLTEDLIRQVPADGRICPDEIMQGIAVFELVQAPDREPTRIRWAEVLELGHPLGEPISLFVGRLPVGVVRRHIMGLHIGEGLLPVFGEAGAAGVFERGLEVYAGLRLPVAVAVQAVVFDEGGHLFAKGLLHLGLAGRQIPVAYRRCVPSRGEPSGEKPKDHGR